jgi:hypothetical protein
MNSALTALAHADFPEVAAQITNNELKGLKDLKNNYN